MNYKRLLEITRLPWIAITRYYNELQEITRDYQRLLEITMDCKRLLEITRDIPWITRDY